jgi:hypothetical protein
MLRRRDFDVMAMLLVLALDAKICPLAPSPELWSQTISYSIDPRSR